MILFKPWKWNRWVILALIPVLPAAYFLSAAPALQILVFKGIGVPLPSMTNDVVITFYQPVWFLAEKSPAANAILNWQHHHLFLWLDPHINGDGDPGRVQQITEHGRTNEIKYPGSRSYRERKAKEIKSQRG